MQFQNLMASELHVVGSTSRIDIDGTGSTQPTIWFGSLDRSNQAFINSPLVSGVQAVGINTSDYDNVRTQHVHDRVFVSNNLVDIGAIQSSDQQSTGGKVQVTDTYAVMFYTDLGAANFSARVRVENNLVRLTDNGNVGVALDTTTDEWVAYNNGTLNWTNLPLLNGWTAKAGYYTPQYRFTPDGLIELRGTMTGGTNADNTQIATMPVVPGKLALGEPHLPSGGTANKRLFYNTDGKLYCYGCAGAGDIGLDGIRMSYK